MGIQNKIEEIRRKPEHIRLRYVWALTIIFTLFIIIIWAFSFKSQNDAVKMPAISEEQKNILDEFGQQKESLKDAAGEMKNALNNQMPSEQNNAQ